jgi:hypothetical protein
MFFNTLKFKATCLVVLSVFLFNCAEEDLPYSKPPNLKLGGPGRECLSQTSTTIDLFIKGKLSSQEVADFWDCLNGALITFTDYTKGRDSEVYTAQEIRAFLAKFFLGDVVINDSMLSSIMEIKRVLMGGSTQSFERAEIERAKAIINELRGLTIGFNPHIRVYYRSVTGRDPEKGIEEEAFDQAMAAFQKGISQIGEIVSRSSEPYSFVQLGIFMRNLHELVHGSEGDVDSWLRYLPLFERGKVLFVGGSEQGISQHEWSAVFYVFSEFLQTLARINVYVTDGAFGDELSLRQVRSIFRSIDGVIERAVLVRESKIIPFTDIDAVIDKVGDVYGFPMGITRDEMKGVVKTLVQEVFTPFEIDSKQVTGVGEIQWSELKREFLFWADSQEGGIEWAQTGRLNPRLRADVYNEWVRIAEQAPWPIRVDDRGKLIFDWSAGQSYDLQSLTTLNWQKSIIRVLISRFATDPERRKKLLFLTQPEIVEMQKAIESIGVALGLFDPGDTSLALRIIREASLFMPRSDGDQSITFEEGVEYLASVISGLQVENILFADLSKKCAVEQPEGERARVEAQCFRLVVKDGRAKYLSHLPQMKNYFTQNGGDGLWTRFEQLQEETVRTEGYNDKPISRSDIMEMWILLQYIETFFGRFDSNPAIGTINVRESLVAYQVYAPYLEVLLRDYPLNGSQRRALFTYLMKYGKIHFFDDAVGGSLRFVWWLLNEDKWQYEADRLRLVQILASLSSFQRNIIGLPLLQYHRPKNGGPRCEAEGSFL